MFKFLKKLFAKKRKSVRVMDDDAVRAEVVRMCFETGKMVVGQRNPDGSVTVTAGE